MKVSNIGQVIFDGSTIFHTHGQGNQALFEMFFYLIRRSSYGKFVGMSLLIEGFAMGAFSNLQANTNDSVLKSLMKLLMRDEATHHNFGQWWLERTLVSMTVDERTRLSEWALRGYMSLYVNLVSVRQRKAIYERFGLDWRYVRDAVREVRRNLGPPQGLEEETNPLSVMANALSKSGLLTTPAKAQLARWVNQGAGP